MNNNLEFIFIDSIKEVSPVDWSVIVNSDYPFIQYDFLLALEESGAVCLGSGWQPCHLIIKQKNSTSQQSELVGVMPLYLKNHSYGEYVFDFEWANAYQRAGLTYYPKLIAAIPFTPASGQRLYLHQSLNIQKTFQQVNLCLQEYCKQNKINSWHLLFPTQSEHQIVSETLLAREGVQYHWFNRDYASFDSYLSQCKIKQRKNIKRERKKVIEQNLILTRLEGNQMTDELWLRFFGFYQQTYAKRSGHYGYLPLDFFKSLGDKLSDSLVIATATYENNVVAASLFFKDRETLYGRYWGCSQEFEFLHFELCYYQGIEYCINHKLKRFDAGAQGEHKIQRGFEPVVTYSNHWIADDLFRQAISDFVAHEKRYIADLIPKLQAKLPFKY